MSSNYPPGVTGNEYQIGGPEAEWTADATCPACGWTGLMLHERHHSFGIRAFCENPKPCQNRVEGFFIEPDIDYEPELEE